MQATGATSATRAKNVDSIEADCRRLTAVALAIVVCASLTTVAPANGASPLSATSSREAREEAIRAIPWGQLSHQQSRAVRKVVGKSSLFRRLPTRIIECDPQIFTFLMQHPDVVADTWQTMGVSKLRVQRAGEHTFMAEDGLGTTGKFSYLEATWSEAAFNRALIFARGSFEGKPLTQAIDANCVILLRSGSYEESDGRTFITVRMDTFLNIDQTSVELLAKTVHPLVNKVADHNFTETLRFVSNFSRAAERNPAGVERFCQKLSNVPESTRAELVSVCDSAAERLALREGQRAVQRAALTQSESAAAAK